MDRSFLSQPEVIAASRSFVCVRLATYEDQKEYEFLKSFHITRSGDVENTTFAILSPDGKKQLLRASRGMNHSFEDAADMAQAMQRISASSKAKPWTEPALPLAANVRLGINIAAADNQPAVVLLADDAKSRSELVERVRSLAWTEPFLGRFVYTATADAKDLSGITGVQSGPGVFIVEPERFGQKATLLKHVAVHESSEALGKAMTESLTMHRRLDKRFASHVREGHRLGVFWETLLPVTDPQELQARERGRSGP